MSLSVEVSSNGTRLGALAIFIAMGVYWYWNSRILTTIPGPGGGIPVLGCRLGLPPRSHEVMREWAWKYGELYKLRIGWYNWVIINSPEAFKEIMDKQSISTSSKIPAPHGHDLVTKGLRVFTMSYGPKWRSHRTIMHRLLAPKMTLTFIPSQDFEAKQFLYELAYENEDQSRFFQQVRRLSFSVVMTSTYGRRIDRWDHPVLQSAGETSELLARITKPGAFIEDDLPFLARLPTWLQPSRRAAKGYAEIILRGKMSYWDEVKQELEAGTAQPSFARSILESDYKAEGLTDEDGAWITGGLVEAGAEITSVVIHNLLLYLAATPDAQRHAHEELDRVVGDSRMPTYEDLPNLPYVRSCVKEIMRICPVPTWAIKHYTDTGVIYKQHRIPKGTVVVANTSALHYDESRYPEPHLFKPERYLNHTLSSAEYATMRDPYQRDHFTFGAGRRMCPAARLAETTLDITTAHLLWAFHLRPPMVKTEKGNSTFGEIDISNDAFSPTAFRAPKPFKLRFVLRGEDKGRMIREQRRIARV